MQTATSPRFGWHHTSSMMTCCVFLLLFCFVLFFWHMATTGIHSMEFSPPWNSYCNIVASSGTNVHEGWTSFSNDKKIFEDQIFFNIIKPKHASFIERIIIFYWCVTLLILYIPLLFGWDNVHTELITRWLRLLWSDSPINECVQSWTIHSLSTALQRVMSCLWEEDYFTWQAVLGIVASAFAPSHWRFVPVMQWMWSSG